MPSNAHGGPRKGAGRKKKKDNGQTNVAAFFTGRNPIEEHREKRGAEAAAAEAERQAKVLRLAEADRKRKEAKEKQRQAIRDKRDADRAEATRLVNLLGRTINGDPDNDPPSNPVVIDGDDDDEAGYGSDGDEDYNDDSDPEDSGGTDDPPPEDPAAAGNNGKKRKSSRHKPRKGTLLHTYLTTKRNELAGDGKNVEARTVGRCWYPAEFSALSYETEPEPFLHCKEVNSTYHFEPIYEAKQGENPASLQSYKCINPECQQREKQYLMSQGWDWRPFHYHHQTVWMLHRRIKCSTRQDGTHQNFGCGKTWAEFHPEFMSQLPQVTQDRFPFIATPSGQGIHKSMMHQFLSLCVKGILFGTHCNSVNEMKMTQHWTDHMSHLDASSNYLAFKDAQPALHGYVPKPFYECDSVGQCNGIVLKPSLMRHLFTQEMRRMEPYMQESHQLECDQGAISDHSFKYSDMIKAPSNRAGNAAGASYDIGSLAGGVPVNRMVAGKGNDEIDPLLDDFKTVRDNAGAGELMRYEGDGGSDRSLWEKHFPELQQGIVKYRPKTKGDLIVATLGETKFVTYSTVEGANDWARSMAQDVGKLTSDTFYGLDTEWNVDSTRDKTRVITIRLPDILCNYVVVLDLTTMGSMEAERFPKLVKKTLENQHLIPVGVQVGGDASRLSKLGIKINRRRELQQLGKKLRPGCKNGFSLQRMCERHLRTTVNKTHQKEDWTLLQQKKELQVYAALDADLHFRLYHKLMELIDSAERDGSLPLTASIGEGTKVNLLYNNKVCARGTLDFYGGNCSESKPWGNMNIGSKKCLVRVEAVTMDAVKPMFSYEPTMDERAAGKKEWNHKKEENTLKRLFQTHRTGDHLLVAWQTHRVQAQLESIEPFVTAADSPAEAFAAAAPTTPVELTPAQEEESLERRSKLYMDRFHLLDAFPSSRDPHLKSLYSLVRRLTMQGTIEFDYDDYRDMTDFLASHHGITETEEVLDHFYFNREHWYQRVRVHPPPASRGEKNIRHVLDFVENNPVFEDIWDEKLKTYFDMLLDHIQQGRMEETHDVQLFQHDGKDKHGLNLWLRRRGSNRSENMHQKMRVAFGPHGVGAEVDHFLLLLVTYRYNKTTGIRRKGYVNFGMPYYWLIDRIQICMAQLFETDLFPSHVNQTLFKPVKGFVAVGFGPLAYDERFVPNGDPHKDLKGDMLFLAKAMKLVGPPLHIATPQEKSIFNQHMKNLGTGKAPKQKDFENLAEEFKRKSDYKYVFPKLPFMLKSYYTKWKATQELVLIKDSIKEGHYDILEKFGVPTEENDSAGAQFQKLASTPSPEALAGGRSSGRSRGSAPAAPANNNFEAAPANPLPVATTAGAGPSQYNVGRIGKDRRKASDRRCAGAPFGCPNLGVDCSWRKWEECQLIKDKDPTVKVPECPVERERIIKAHHDLLKAQQSAEARREKKRKKLENQMQEQEQG